jgi:hypothetical protein
MKRLIAFLAALLLSTATLAATTPKVVAKAAAAATTVNASATLSWPAVTIGTNGATLSGVTYNVWDGNIAAGGTCTASSMTQVASGITALTDTIPLSNMTSGTIECFAVSASAGGQTGALSNIVPYTIPTVITLPDATTLSITVVVSSP